MMCYLDESVALNVCVRILSNLESKRMSQDEIPGSYKKRKLGDI